MCRLVLRKYENFGASFNLSDTDLRVDKLAVSGSLNTTGRSPRPASPASSTRAGSRKIFSLRKLSKLPGQIAAGVLLVEPSVGKDPILASAGPPLLRYCLDGVNMGIGNCT